MHLVEALALPYLGSWQRDISCAFPWTHYPGLSSLLGEPREHRWHKAEWIGEKKDAYRTLSCRKYPISYTREQAGDCLRLLHILYSHVVDADELPERESKVINTKLRFFHG